MADKRKILVVDDEPAVTLMISAFLSHMSRDYELHRALDKEKALEILKAENPEVVLLDIDLYGINSGLQILDIINKEHKNTKPIVITGRAKTHRQEIEKIGCFHFFEKPVDAEELQSKIKEALNIPNIVEAQNIHAFNAHPKARLLFIEKDLRLYAYFCAIFDAKELLNGAVFETKIIDNIADILNVLASYQPDIVIIGDFHFEDSQILTLVNLIKNHIKIKPKAIIVHGLFERGELFEIELKKQGAEHCVQNVMDNEMILKMNRKLSDFVSNTCVKSGLIK